MEFKQCANRQVKRQVSVLHQELARKPIALAKMYKVVGFGLRTFIFQHR